MTVRTRFHYAFPSPCLSALKAVLKEHLRPVRCHCDLSWPSPSHLEMQVSAPCPALTPGVPEELAKEFAGSVCDYAVRPQSAMSSPTSATPGPAERQRGEPSAPTCPSEGEPAVKPRWRRFSATSPLKSTRDVQLFGVTGPHI